MAMGVLKAMMWAVMGAGAACNLHTEGRAAAASQVASDAGEWAMK